MCYLSKVDKKLNFSFKVVSLSEIEIDLNLTNPRKSTTSNNFPQRVLKSTTNDCSEILETIVKNFLIEVEFPIELKLVDVTPMTKREEISQVKNYRPATILLSEPKVFEKILHNQVS